MPTTSRASSTVKFADPMLTLFELLSAWGREMSHTGFTEALGIPKSSLTELLKSIVGCG